MRRRPASISTHGQAHEQVGESLRRLWRQARSCFPSSLGPSLLPQSLQGQLSCKVSARPCAHEKVVRLLCSRNDVARAGTPSGPALIRAGYDTSRGSLAPATLRCRARNGNLRCPISHLPVIFPSRHRPSSTLTDRRFTAASGCHRETGRSA